MIPNHFISASCGSPCAVCFKPSTHKLGEEIAHDEPCIRCGASWMYDRGEDGQRAIRDPDKCKGIRHLTGPNGQRHNLTAYVCCFHFYMIVGAYAGCPLTKSETEHLAYIRAYTDPDNVWDNCRNVKCENCHEDLKFDTFNIKSTLAFVICDNCGQASTLANHKATTT